MVAFWILVIGGVMLLVRWYANETRRGLVACLRVAQETSMLRRLHVSGSARISVRPPPGACLELGGSAPAAHSISGRGVSFE